MPTGMLSNTMDLLSHPKPWIMPLSAPKQESLDKNILIFADHFFYRRDLYEQEEIRKNLTRKKNEGFKIKLLTPLGKIVDWEYQPIPADYSLDIKKYDDEAIKKLAWEQCKISANSLGILDNFGLNEIRETNLDSTEIKYSLVANDIQILTETLNYKKLLCYSLHLSREDLAALRESKSHERLTTIKKLTIDTLSDVEFLKIFSIFPDIEAITVDQFLGEIQTTKIPLKSLAKIKKIHLGGMNFSPDTITFFLQNCPLLEDLFLPLDSQYYKTISLQNAANIRNLALQKKSTKSLQTFGIDKNLDPIGMENLLRNFPKLESLGVWEWNEDQIKMLSKFRAGDLPNVKQFIGPKEITSELFTHVLQVIPNIEYMDLTKLYIEGPLVNTAKLKNLNSLFCDDVHLEHLDVLLEIAPNLQELRIDSSIDFLPNNLLPSKIKVINSQKKMAYDVFHTLCAISPKLQKLTTCIEFDEKFVGKFQSLPFLETLDIFVGGDASKVDSVISFLKATPNLLTLKINPSKLITQAFLALPNNHFSKLISLNVDCNLFGYTDSLDKILSKASNIEELVLNYTKPGYGEIVAYNLLYLAPNSLLKLKKISGKLICSEKAFAALKAAAPYAEIEPPEIIPEPAPLKVTTDTKPKSAEKPPIKEEKQTSSKKEKKQTSPKKETKVPAKFNIDELKYFIPLTVKPKSQIQTETKVFTPVDIKKSKPRLVIDTESHNPTCSYFEYFPGVEARRYRLRQWDVNLDAPFDPENGLTYKIPSEFKSTTLPIKNYFKDSKYESHAGIMPVNAKLGKEIILPSLDAEEIVFDVKLVDPTGKIIKVYTEIERDPSTGFAKISLPRAGEFTIHFAVAIPEKRKSLPEALENLSRKYQQFKPKKFNGEPKTIRDFAQLIHDQETGGCKHRAFAAYNQLSAQGFKESQLRIIGNDVHIKFEVKIENEWYNVELGGYPAELRKVTDIPIFNPSKNKSVPSFIITETSMEEIIKERKQACLIKTDSDTAIIEFLKKLKETKQDIYIARRPEDLTVSTKGMSKDGRIIENNFSIWLRTCQNGTIVIDIRNWTATEIAQLNDLLDRFIEKEKIPDYISIKIIDKNDCEYGPDFCRRVPFKTTIDAHFPLLEEISAEAKEDFVIDLFDSPYWRRMLTGMWGINEKKEVKQADKSSLTTMSSQSFIQRVFAKTTETLSEDDLTFCWKPGSLLDRLLSKGPLPKRIIFKNPPLYDKSFCDFVIDLKGLSQVEWADEKFTLPSIEYSQIKGIDWKNLISDTSIECVTDFETQPLFLSDTSIISFLESSFAFSKETNKLVKMPAHFKQHANKTIDIRCAYRLSDSTLALFLIEAKKYNIKINFVTPSLRNLSAPMQLILSNQSPKEVKERKTTNVNYGIHTDLDFAVRNLLLNSTEPVVHFDMSYLQPSELGRPVIFTEAQRAKFMAMGKLSMHADFSDVVKMLKSGTSVVLSGPIPPSLYSELTSLSTGFIEGEKFSGKLTILTSPNDSDIVEGLAGYVPAIESASEKDKLALFKKLYNLTRDIDTSNDFASVETSLLQEFVNSNQKTYMDNPELSDELNADSFDACRLHNVELAFSINPWVMIPGPTGVGKTNFIEEILGKKYKCYTNFEEWLMAKPVAGKHAIYIGDEANFASELNGKGENFLSRFKCLRNKPPIFLYNGKQYTLTNHHKAAFLFNPASYGAGREAKGFLVDQALNVPFSALPASYIRARIVKPLLQKVLKKRKIDFKYIIEPLIFIYNWLVKCSPEKEILITPRHLKAMVNIIASNIIRQNLKKTEDISNLSLEVAHLIGRQVLANDPENLDLLDNACSEISSVLTKSDDASQFPKHQNEARAIIKGLFDAREILSAEQTDLGLGGVLLEGDSGIGKTHFVNRMIHEFKQRFPNNPVYRISPNTPFFEKVSILNEAFEKKGLVVGEEFNASLWPNKLLNNYLMGLDANNKPAANPGFMFIATQNPGSFSRYDDDLAVIQRLVKLTLNWPVFEKPTLSITPRFFSDTMQVNYRIQFKVPADQSMDKFASGPQDAEFENIHAQELQSAYWWFS